MGDFSQEYMPWDRQLITSILIDSKEMSMLKHRQALRKCNTKNYSDSGVKCELVSLLYFFFLFSSVY